MANTFWNNGGAGTSPAGNVWGAGSDSNSGLTRLLPKATAEAAVAAATVAGDTITGWLQSDYTPTTFINLTRGQKFVSEVFGAYKLKGVATTARVIACSAASGTITVQGFYIDAQSLATAVITYPNTSVADLQVLDCTLANPAGSSMLADTNTSVKLTVKRTALAGAATTGGIVSSAMGATKFVDIDGVTGSVTGTTASKGGSIVLTATATGATARIENCNGLSVTCSGTGTAAPVRLIGVTGLVQNNKSMSVNEASASTGCGIIMVDPVAGVQADAGRIIGNSGRNNTSGGYLQRIGTDGAAATDNLTNNWFSALNDFGGNPAASIMHGYMFGSCVGGLSVLDTARTVAIPLLSKLQTTGAQFICPRVEMPVGTTAIFYSKGSVAAQCIGLQARLPRGYGGYVYQISDDPTVPTHSTGAVCNDGNIWSDDPSGVSLAVAVNASNTASFANNNWSFVAVTGTPWTYQSNTYATQALWAAAQEPSARNVTVTNLDATFHRNAYKAALPALSLPVLRAVLPLVIG